MAFFSSLSSTIGKKLLLFGLRHIDILDKDPTDFVNVDVGKTTTLEISDVGLHVKKLVALLHLKLPPEIHVSKARASLFRITFVLDFGVPQITIEIDGIQVHAQLAEEEAEPPSKSRGKERSSPRARSPHASRALFDSTGDDASDVSEDDEYGLTIDELAQSFIREEPQEEIKELEHELESRSEYIASSASSSDDGEDESAAGMGAPLALPVYLRNLLNTALDRLSIVVKDVDVELQDQYRGESRDPAKEDEHSYTSVNLHIDRIAIDSAISELVHLDFPTGLGSKEDSGEHKGKRRLRFENVCARLISDAEDFISRSRASRSISPIDTRSEASSIQKTQSDLSPNRDLAEQSHLIEAQEQPPSPDTSPHISPAASPRQTNVYAPVSPQNASPSASATDDDRFADAVSEDGLDASIMSDSRQSLPDPGPNADSLLYSDDGFLDYALQNNLLESRLEESEHDPQPVLENNSHNWRLDRSESSHVDIPLAETSGLLSASALAQQEVSVHDEAHDIVPESVLSCSLAADAVQQSAHASAEEPVMPSAQPPSPTFLQNEEELSQSRLFTSDEAESMYMSAMSGMPMGNSHAPNLPGGWDSSASSSSRDTGSDTSGPIPESMIAGSILAAPPDGDDGLETPRAGTPQSRFSSPLGTRQASEDNVSPLTDQAIRPTRYGKVFLTIDEITIWFPLGLNDARSSDPASDPIVESTGTEFDPHLVEDSIFQTMPGSFSNYAHSTASLRKPAAEGATRKAPEARRSPKGPSHATKKSEPAISAEIGTVTGQIDFSTGQIMFHLIQRALSVVTRGSTVDGAQAVTEEKVPQAVTHQSAGLVIKHITIEFKDRLIAQPVNQQAAAQVAMPTATGSILKISLSSLRAISQSNSDKSYAKLQIGKFALSSLDHNIIAFRSGRARARKSVGAPPEQINGDIELYYECDQDRRLTVKTRPVKVMIDLEKLDESLSSFGGFSGILELSASFTPNHASSPIASVSAARPRGVHFKDTPAPSPPPQPSNFPKLQVQLDEVSLHLKGKTCGVQLRTSTVRIVVREDYLRLKVSEIGIIGPCVESNQAEAPLMVEIKDAMAVFLFVPEHADLDRLISIIAPSKDPYESNEDILIDTLLQQRRKGSLLRVEIGSIAASLSDRAHMKTFEALGVELAKLSKVTKYLPDDDRPGILTLALIQHCELDAMVNDDLGNVSIKVKDASVAHVGVPALFAAELGTLSVSRGDEVLVHEVVTLHDQDHLPMVMVRFVGDEMEPVVKAKLFNVCAEYRVSTVMAALGISEDGTVDDIAMGLASSVATITRVSSQKTLSRQSSASESPSMVSAKPLHVDLLLRNCACGLNPRSTPAKGLFVLTDAHFLGQQSKNSEYAVEIQLRKASIQAIDDAARLGDEDGSRASSARFLVSNRQLQDLAAQGYVSLGSISAAKVLVNITGDGDDHPQQVDVELKNDLLVLESCADSTQTLIAIMNGLQPPASPSSVQQYREQAGSVVPIDEMMQSISREAFPGADDDDFMENADLVPDEVPTNLEYVGSFYNQDSLPTEEELGDSLLGEDDLEALASPSTTRLRGERGLLESFQERYEVAEGEKDFDFDDNYFKESDSEPQGKARKWSSTKNTYHLTNEFKGRDAPLKVRIRDVNIIWNIYEGYDWPHTRSTIAHAVENVELKAEQRRQKPQYEEEEDDFVEEDFLFNSVWIGVPVNEEKGALAKRINEEINRRPDDQMSETGSYATSTATRSTGATLRPGSANRSSRTRLKLERSKYKRIAFELRGVDVDFVTFPPDSGETVNSIDVRVRNCEIYDHIPKSNWKKFMTCQIDPRDREMDRPMINLQILTVKPVTGLAASELVIKAHILPLLLHVDQDALDFIKAFFAFKDSSAPEQSSPADGPFIQRLEVVAVKVDFHYKPRRVDYRGLRAGRTSELMNFFVLDGAKFTLKHVILYGIQSFDKLHDILSDIWTPDVTRNQLPGVLGGLAVVRPLVDVGSGVRDLVVVPVREYRKDGRIVRSLQKGIFAFATHTTSEVARLGAKVAIGTQTILEGAEKFLNPAQASPGRTTHHDWDGDDPSSDSEEQRHVSNYANQPIGMRAGLQSAARHLQRDLLAARDAVIAMPAEVMEDGTGLGVAKVLARRAPTIVLRPAMGAMKATSNTLLGLGNALDKQSRRKIDDKYKSH